MQSVNSPCICLSCFLNLSFIFKRRGVHCQEPFFFPVKACIRKRDSENRERNGLENLVYMNLTYNWGIDLLRNLHFFSGAEVGKLPIRCGTFSIAGSGLTSSLPLTDCTVGCRNWWLVSPQTAVIWYEHRKQPITAPSILKHRERKLFIDLPCRRQRPTPTTDPVLFSRHDGCCMNRHGCTGFSRREPFDLRGFSFFF